VNERHYDTETENQKQNFKNTNKKFHRTPDTKEGAEAPRLFNDLFIWSQELVDQTLTLFGLSQTSQHSSD
jgi:hypothetical protein